MLNNSNNISKAMKIGLIRRNDILFIGAFVLFALLPIIIYWHEFLDPDESYFMFIGNKIAHGSVLYKDFIDNKPPGIFYLDALIFLIFGKSFIAARIILLIFNAISALAIYFIGKNLWNESAGRISSIFFLIGLYVECLPGIKVQTEQFMVCFGLLGFLVFFLKSNYWKYLILTGFLLGMASLFKQPGVLFYLIIFLYYLLDLIAEKNRNFAYIYRSIKSLILIGCGFLIPILVTTLYFYKMGTMYDFIYWSILFFIEGNYGSRIQLFKLALPLYELILLWVLALFSAVLIIYRYITNKYNSNILFLAIWALIFFCTLAIRQYVNYLIPILPPVCLLASIAFEKLLPLFYLRNIKTAISRKDIIKLVIIICIIALAIFNIYMIAKTDIMNMKSNELVNQINASKFIVSHTIPGEKILSFPFEPFIYFMSDRDPPVKYPFFVHYPMDRNKTLDIINQINIDQIKYVVVNTNIVSAGNKDIYQFILENYFKNSQMGRWAIYIRESAGEKNVTYWNRRGIYFRTQGMYNESIQAFDKALEMSPDYVPAWINKGMLLRMQGKYGESLNAYNKAIEINSDEALAWFGKGNLLYKMERYEDAQKAWDEAIRLDPKLAGAWESKGLALNDQGKYNEAIKCFDEAIRLDPNSIISWSNKGKALKLLGRTAESEAAFSKVRELSSS